MLGATFKQAEEQDLLGVVLVKGQPYKTLTRSQINWIRGKLLTTLLETARAGGDTPVFEESGVWHNRFHLSCTDNESYVWLEDTVGSFNIEGDGEGETLALELVPASEVPRLLRAEVFSGPPVGVPNFLTLIQSQNKTLHTERWVLRHQQSTKASSLSGVLTKSQLGLLQPRIISLILGLAVSHAGDEAGTT